MAEKGMTLQMNEDAKFEIIVDGKTRTYRDTKAVALDAARYLKNNKGNKEVKVHDHTTGEIIDI